MPHDNGAVVMFSGKVCLKGSPRPLQLTTLVMKITCGRQNDGPVGKGTCTMPGDLNSFPRTDRPPES